MRAILAILTILTLPSAAAMITPLLSEKAEARGGTECATPSALTPGLHLGQLDAASGPEA